MYSATAAVEQKNHQIVYGKELQIDHEHWNSKHEYKRRKYKNQFQPAHIAFPNNNRLSHEWNGKILINVGNALQICLASTTNLNVCTRNKNTGNCEPKRRRKSFFCCEARQHICIDKKTSCSEFEKKWARLFKSRNENDNKKTQQLMQLSYKISIEWKMWYIRPFDAHFTVTYLFIVKYTIGRFVKRCCWKKKQTEEIQLSLRENGCNYVIIKVNSHQTTTHNAERERERQKYTKLISHCIWWWSVNE